MAFIRAAFPSGEDLLKLEVDRSLKTKSFICSAGLFKSGDAGQDYGQEKK